MINSNRKWFKYCWVWEKEQGVNFLLAKKQPLKVHEDIVVFSDGVPTYFPQMTQGKPYISGKGNSGEVTKSVAKVQTKNEGTRYPKSIIRFNRQTGLHPTQKPISLLEYLIKTYTQRGALVLDPFMGSWSTAVACRNIGRDWIGAEQLEKYCDVGEKRIGECQVIEMQLSDIVDRYTICLLKWSHAEDDDLKSQIEKEVEYYKTDLSRRTFYDELVPYIKSLYSANKAVWELESDIRKAKENEMGLEEVGRRAILIREHNAERIRVKNEISEKFGGFVEHKMDHISAGKK